MLIGVFSGCGVHCRFTAPVALALPVLLVVCLGVAGCSSEPEVRGRVLVIGIDGATLRIARPMLDRGELPNLAKLGSSGAFGALRSHFPLTSPRIWASIATGKLPTKHGILNFSKIEPDGSRHLFTSRDRKAHALWNIVSDAGFKVAVINWWTTFPLEKVNGVIVSDHLLPMELKGRRRIASDTTASATGSIVFPKHWQEQVEALVADEEPLTAIGDPFADASVFPDWILPEKLSQRYQNDQAVTRIAMAVDRELQPDLLMVFLPGIDRVSHRLWFGVEPDSAYKGDYGLTDAKKAAMKDGLHQYYRYTDALIGKLTSGFGADDLVLVVSDHGFEAGTKMMVLTGVHDSHRALDGVFFASGPDVVVPGTDRLVSVNDITPSVLRWLGIPLGADMDGRPAPFIDLPIGASIPSHDTTTIDYVDDGESGMEAEILDRLQSLGYFEDEKQPTPNE
jgi:predicted AlkP superfamily phosphohydrolase/phosphomutase